MIDDSYTVALLHMNGADASTVFTDEAKKVWTVAGGAQIDTAQYKFGLSSYYSDGSGDYIYCDGSDFAFGSGDFTIDFWHRPSGTNFQILYDSRPASGQGLYPTIYMNANIVYFYTNTDNRITGTTTLSANTWYHIAIVKYNNQTKLYINGTNEGNTYSDTNTYLNGSNRPVIGNGNNLSGDHLKGWMDELRVSKGKARWTANFTPPTAPYGAFDDSYTKVLLHMDEVDASPTFTDEIGKYWANNGNAQIDTAQYKFGNSSGLFDGNGDYLSVANSTDFDFGTGDFTIDFWLRRNGNQSNYAGIFATSKVAELDSGYNISFTSSTEGINKIILASAMTGSWAINLQSTTALSDATWTHIAIVRYGNTMTLYINGTAEATYNCTGKTLNSEGVGAVLALNHATGGSSYYNGWIDEFRISKGIARWTANFTPPTAAYLPSAGLPRVKTVNGIAASSIKTINGIAASNIKTMQSL